MKTPQERGAFASWVVDARKTLRLSTHTLATQSGYSDAAIRKLESGRHDRPIRRRVIDVLLKLSAEANRPIDPPPFEGPDLAAFAQGSPDVAALIRAQTEAMWALVEELKLGREVQRGQMSGLAAVLADLANTLEQLRLEPAGKRRPAERRTD